jgi:hypothetical protein
MLGLSFCFWLCDKIGIDLTDFLNILKEIKASRRYLKVRMG